MTQSKFKSLITILSLGIILTVNYNNCGDAMQFSVDSKVQQDGGGGGIGGGGGGGGGTGGGPIIPTVNNDPNDNLDVVQKTCMNSTPQVVEYSVGFINPENQSCNFGKGDNLPAADGFFQGHIDQGSNFSLPAGATLCGMSFQFENSSARMRYDDHFLLTFNDVVLAGTFDFSGDLDKALGMNLYSWSKIRGTPWHSRTNLEGVFCEGAKQGLASCTWPATDTYGSINMSFDNSVFQKIFALNPARTSHSFHLISIGDNDANDCEISPINFKVRVQYVK